MGRPTSPEPVLLLSHEDFCRLKQAVRPRRRRSSSVADGILALSVVLVLAAGAWFARRSPSSPSAVDAPRLPAGADVSLSPVAASTAVIPETPETPDPDPEPVPEADERPASRLASPKPWHEGRAWVRLRVRMVEGATSAEVERLVTLVWDGSRFVVRDSNKDLWSERVSLLLQLPSPDDAWRRQVNRTDSEILTGVSEGWRCRRVEGEDQFPEGVRKFPYWYSDEFPAGAIQAEQTLGDITFSCRVLEFGPAHVESER